MQYPSKVWTHLPTERFVCTQTHQSLTRAHLGPGRCFSKHLSWEHLIQESTASLIFSNFVTCLHLTDHTTSLIFMSWSWWVAQHTEFWCLWSENCQFEPGLWRTITCAGVLQQGPLTPSRGVTHWLSLCSALQAIAKIRGRWREEFQCTWANGK